MDPRELVAPEPHDRRPQGEMIKSALRFALAALALVFAVFTANAEEVVVFAREPGYFTSLAKHVTRWLAGEGIAAPTRSAGELASSLKGAKLAFLIGYNEPDAAEMRELAAFRARGGKLVVFYSASPALARLMGVKVNGYRTAKYPGEWSRFVFTDRSLPGTPGSILQTSTVLQSASPLKGSRTLATWVDRNGRSTGEAAFLATPGGWWMTHVMLADGDERLKARFLAAIVGNVLPSRWNWEKAKAKLDTEAAATRRYALSVPPATAEIHAVWDHSGCGLYPGDWPRTIALLKDAGVTDLFVNVAGAAFAHYSSDVLPRSKTFTEEGDQLKACLEAAAKSGIRVHAWVLCFTATRGSPARLEDFAKRGWRLKSTDGKLTEYLDPSNPAVREHIFKAIDEIQSKYPLLGGIHLDFVRWYEKSVRPKNAAEVISKFVVEARRHVKRPRWFTTAVLGKYPACVASVGQDWNSWLRTNSVDFVVPMDYTEDREWFAKLVAQHASTPGHAGRTIAGIGVTANESRLDARGVLDEIKLARAQRLAGVALFDLDTTLEKDVLPYLKLGAWKNGKAAK